MAWLYSMIFFWKLRKVIEVLNSEECFAAEAEVKLYDLIKGIIENE